MEREIRRRREMTEVIVGPEADLQPEAPSPVEPVEELGVEEQPVHLSPVSIWPITMAAGIALLGSGLVTTWEISALGFVTFVVAIVYWVQELRHEPQSH